MLMRILHRASPGATLNNAFITDDEGKATERYEQLRERMQAGQLGGELLLVNRAGHQWARFDSRWVKR